MIENYTDIGASTPEAIKISRKSRELISSMIGDRSLEDRITQRCVIATGDPSTADIMRFQNDPFQAGLKALERGAPIYVDIKMVQAGVLKKGHTSPIEAFIDKGDELAASRGITRTSAGVFALNEKLSGSIAVIGNAPSALLTLCELMESGRVQPDLVIGVPVGFVNALESKERLREISVPSISTAGTRGGTPIAVAAINEIINTYARERP
ncbi:MAG TPA: precorrin-8X methylmutase [Methanothrix soehngenii]|jgi:precorrin-8X/cobalt-precorrin-8 methylmutase|uniref:Precorrin-8X methylmutase n=2 Tax=root TaxID=1 RepID=A0A7K4AGF5_METSH|nr:MULTISPECIES: precorrin-8X methylmutase [Methanothrix]MBP7068158.1 precorrin-8X methylmutase [Methanothrix sp.]MDD3550563.1 precorrin-8X methylmutase [Methanothrix soehngenii]MDY0410863.1 precorrin-8X methylmutase [Methanothrix soehngenii]NLJ22060.1 precorrin-8X methylmutase [Methanothrix soehngenii]UEC39823.1 MAG: Cobalt-precorrin-8 methylmutase [Methanothrix sp.]